MSHQNQPRQPVLAVSHESPMMWDTPSPARAFLKSIADLLPQAPSAVIVVSAHWHTRLPSISSATTPAMIYDFGGFADHYRQVHYPAPGAPDLAASLQAHFHNFDLPCELDSQRGFDHAVWLTAGLAFPKAEIPIISLSVQPRARPAQHFAIGRALAAMRDENVLILASGTGTHNLRAFFTSQEFPAIDAPADADALAFSTWLEDTIARNNHAALLDYRKVAPAAARVHPSPDHFLPFIVAAGAGSEDKAERVHHSVSYGHFMMDAFRWR